MTIRVKTTDGEIDEHEDGVDTEIGWGLFFGSDRLAVKCKGGATLRTYNMDNVLWWE